MGRTLTGFVLAAGAALLTSAAALAQHAPGEVLVRAIGFGGGMPMSDLDGYIKDNLGTLLTPGAGRSTLDELGFCGGGGGEVGYMVTPRWSVALAVTEGSS